MNLPSETEVPGGDFKAFGMPIQDEDVLGMDYTSAWTHGTFLVSHCFEKVDSQAQKELWKEVQRLSNERRNLNLKFGHKSNSSLFCSSRHSESLYFTGSLHRFCPNH